VIVRLHWTNRGALLAAAALAAAAFAGAQDRDRSLGSVGITVFEHPNYRGRNATFREPVRDLGDYHLNDRVSSFRIARGESWEVCEDADFRGRCTVFSADEPDLSRVSWDETISSLRPVRPERPRWDDRERDRREAHGLVLFDQRNFRGQARELDRPEPDLREFGRRVSSVNVGRRAWELCTRPDFRGRCVLVSEDVPDLRAVGIENEVGSARPVRDEGRREPSWRPPEPPRLILYDRPDFRGRAREVTDTEEEISDFNDRAQSARVVRGTWQLCEHRGFRGRCVTLTSDARDLNAVRMGSAVTSARPIVDERR
jgi:hypothetical protein